MMRSDLARWIAVAVFTPLLVLSAFGGTTFLAHGHDAHGLHLHAGHSVQGAEYSAARHIAAHDQGRCVLDGASADADHGPAESQRGCPADNEPAPSDADHPPVGVIVSVPDHDQIPTQPAELSKALSAIATILFVEFQLPACPAVERCISDPGGRVGHGPRDLVAVRAGDRLVRTSRALLI